MDINIGPSFDANTPINEILGAIRINPEPEPITIDIDYAETERETIVRVLASQQTFTINHEQAANIANGSSVSEGKRWAMQHFGIEDEATALTITAAAIGLHRALSDLGLVLEYELTFRIQE